MRGSDGTKLDLPQPQDKDTEQDAVQALWCACELTQFFQITGPDAQTLQGGSNE